VHRNTSREFSGNGDKAPLLWEETGSSGLGMEKCAACIKGAAVGLCSHSQAGQDTTRRSATHSSSAAEVLTSSTVYELSAMLSKQSWPGKRGLF